MILHSVSAAGILAQVGESSNFGMGCFHGSAACLATLAGLVRCAFGGNLNSEGCPRTQGLACMVIGAGFAGRFINWCQRVGVFTLSKTVSVSLGVFSAISLFPLYFLSAVEGIQGMWSVSQLSDSKVANFVAHLFDFLSTSLIISYGVLEIASLVGGMAVAAETFKIILLASFAFNIAREMLKCCYSVVDSGSREAEFIAEGNKRVVYLNQTNYITVNKLH